ncbi:MAG: hypothetical protein WCF23_04870, partial [Candidatus Nitrosopolaris sp.]
ILISQESGLRTPLIDECPTRLIRKTTTKYHNCIVFKHNHLTLFSRNFGKHMFNIVLITTL